MRTIRWRYNKKKPPVVSELTQRYEVLHPSATHTNRHSRAPPPFPTTITPECQRSPSIVPPLLVITIIKAARICMVSFTKSSPSVWAMKSREEQEDGRGEKKKLPQEQQTKWKQQSQPKACSLEQELPEQRRCCVFPTTPVLYGGLDLSRAWPPNL